MRRVGSGVSSFSSFPFFFSLVLLFSFFFFRGFGIQAGKARKRLSARSKRALHSLHHRNVTRPSRPRQVVSCSSRSDGSKKRTEPTKEVKSLIWQTKLASATVSFSLFFLLYLLLRPFFVYSHPQSIHVPDGRMARTCFLRYNPTQRACNVSQPAFELQRTSLQSRVTRIRARLRLRLHGLAIFPSCRSDLETQEEFGAEWDATTRIHETNSRKFGWKYVASCRRGLLSSFLRRSCRIWNEKLEPRRIRTIVRWHVQLGDFITLARHRVRCFEVARSIDDFNVVMYRACVFRLSMLCA